MTEEKRAHQRVVTRHPVQIKLADGREMAGTVENLGALGAFVSTLELEPLVEVGDRMDLSIAVSETAPLDAAGQVLRVDQEFAGGEIRRTFAVRFDEELETPSSSSG